MSFRAWLWKENGPATALLDQKDVEAALLTGGGLVWVDFAQPTEDDRPFMTEVCRLHHLSVQDCLSTEIHSPRAHDFGSYLSLILHGIDYKSESSIVETTELMLFIGRDLVVSSHRGDLANVNEMSDLVGQEGSAMSRGASFLAYVLADSLTEHVFPALDQMNQFADQVEESAISTPRQETLDAIISLKRSASTLSRILTLQRDMLSRISRDEAGFLSPSVVFFRDVYDRMLAIEGLAISLRERAQDAMSTYLSSVANRQNESMKMLAILATAFLPMGLLVGAFGMNFSDMPGSESSLGFYMVILVMVLILAVVIAIFWLRSWIVWGHRNLIQSSSFQVAETHLTSYADNLRYWMVEVPVKGGRNSLRIGKLFNPLTWL